MPSTARRRTTSNPYPYPQTLTLTLTLTLPLTRKVGHAPSAHPDYFSVAVANSTGASAKLVITSNPQRGWSALPFQPEPQPYP